MTKKLICLVCGENISMKIDLNKLTISSDCKNEHHLRELPFNAYYNYLPNSMREEVNNNKKYVFYCFICQKNVELAKIKDHNQHDGIKLSLKEFLSKDNCLEYKSSIMHKNFNKYTDKINQIIKDFKEWKNKLDKKYAIFIQFLENLMNIEKYFFEDILNNENKEEKLNDYESLMNLKEIYMINNEIKNFINDYSRNINNNFSKISYFFINKIKDINEEEINIPVKNIELFYKNNKCFFNEEIKYKKERNDNIFPLIKNLFTNCKHFVGFDPRYFSEDEKNDIINNNLGDNNFHNFLLKVKNQFPYINHLSLMRNKSYFSCSLLKQIIIIKENKNNLEIINSLYCSDFFNNNNSKVIFSLELSNKKLIGITEDYLNIFESNEEDYYKNYTLSKKILLKNKINDIIQVSPKLFCTLSQKAMLISFWDIKYMEIVTNIGNIQVTQGNEYYMHMINKSDLLITGSEYIYILSIINMEIKTKIITYGLVSSFCILPKNGILCAEIVFNYGPNSPYGREINEYNLVQYQINEKEIQKISEKIKVHKDIIRNLYYLGNNIILSCSINDELKIWY